MLPRSMMSSGSRGQQGQEDEGWANASPGQAERGFAGRSEAANPAGNPGVCVHKGARVLVCRLIHGQCICSNKGFCNSKHMDKRWDIEFLMVIRFLYLTHQAKRRLDQVQGT